MPYTVNEILEDPWRLAQIPKEELDGDFQRACVRAKPLLLMYFADHTVELCIEAVSRSGTALEQVDLPTRRLTDPLSGELEAWISVLDACVAKDGRSLDQLMCRLEANVPLGKAYMDEWAQPLPDGRCMLDLLAMLANEVERLGTDHAGAQRFVHRVRKQEELALQHRAEEPSTDHSRPIEYGSEL